MAITSPGTDAPADTAGRWERVRTPVLVTGALAAATFALRLRDPHEPGSWGWCPSAALGFSCPGCGGLRAVNDLTHGDLAAAASSNLLLVVLLPVGVALLLLWTADRWRGRTRRLGRGARVALVALGVAAVVFTVLRNLAIGAWLAP